MSTPTIILVGRIVKIKKDGNLFNAGTTKNGKNYIQFRILCSNRVKNPDGSWGYGASCSRTCEAWNDLATHIQNSIKEGDEYIVIGNESDDRFEDSSGITHYTQKVNVREAGPSLKWGTAQLVNANQQAGPRQASTTPAMAPQAGSDPWGSSGFDGFGQPAGEPAF